MNYRHAFHAGNFGDCVKHALLVALLRDLSRKPAPLFVLDTHAGAGRYDLLSDAARRGNEAASGIALLLDATPPALEDYVTLARRLGGVTARGAGRDDDGNGGVEPAAGLPPFGRCGAKPAPRLPQFDRSGAAGMTEGAQVPTDGVLPPAIARAADQPGPMTTYPGSPVLIRGLLRADDRLACCEAHPEDFAALRALFRRDRQVATHHRDGWQALKALLPPSQKRGLVLIDPPYEEPGEFARLAAGLTLARARFPNGVLAAWYPVKHRAPVRALFEQLRLRDVIALELMLRAPLDPARLNGCGMLIVNPPHQFDTVARPVLDALLGRLGDGEAGAAATVTRLADE